MIYRFLVLLLLAGPGCAPPVPSASVPTAPAADTTVTELPCEDPGWAAGDTLFRSPEPSFFYTIVPEIGFTRKIALPEGSLGVIASREDAGDELALGLYLTDSAGEWRQIYCGSLDAAFGYQVTMPDLNFDGDPDILIDGNTGGNYGHFTVGFVYHPRQKTFRRDTALDLSNLNIDTKNKRLRSRHYGSVYGACIKSLYGWENNTLVLLEEAVFHADTEESAIIRLKKRQKDGAMQQDSITGELDPLWEIFDRRCAWKGDWIID